MLAQGVRDLDPCAGELGRGDLLDERQARPAARPRARARLDAREVGAPVLGDRAADRARADVVARADRGVVGQLEARRPAAGPLGRRNSPGRPGAPYRASAAATRTARRPRRTRRPGACVRRRTGRASCRRPRPGRPTPAPSRPRCGRARHRSSRRRPLELELRRGVRAGERRLAAEQAVRDDLRHGVARRDEAEAATLDARDLAHGPTCSSSVRHARSTTAPPRSPTASPAARARARRAAARPSRGPRRRRRAGRRRRSRAGPRARSCGRPHLLGPGVAPDRDAHAVDEALEGLAAAQVDLRVHQVRAELDDRGLRAEGLERARGLEAQETAADDGAADRALPTTLGRGVAPLLLDPAAQGRDVVDRAVDEHAGQLVAGDRGRAAFEPVARTSSS